VADAPNAAAKGDPLSDDYRTKSATAICAALASLVDAEARRATPAEVPALHRSWLEAAAPVVGRVQQGKLAAALEPALARLAAKSPEYLAQVQAYEASTTELLRWKRRSAEAAVAPFVAQQPALEVAFQKATISGQGYTGLFAFEKPDFPHPQLLAAAPLLLPLATEKLLQQPVVITQGQGLAGGKAAVTRLRQRTFATLKLPAESLAAAVAGFEPQLLVSADHPPLTLAATAALRSLQQGDFVAAGGEISGVHLEGWITRLAGLPDAATPIVSLGDLPVDAGPAGFGVSTLSQASMRFEVSPKWLRHEYLVVPVGN
jgi:hypothetical protein